RKRPCGNRYGKNSMVAAQYAKFRIPRTWITTKRRVSSAAYYVIDAICICAESNLRHWSAHSHICDIIKSIQLGFAIVYRAQNLGANPESPSLRQYSVGRARGHVQSTRYRRIGNWKQSMRSRKM